MKRFYKMFVRKELSGSAIVHREPTIQGKAFLKVTDFRTRGQYKLVIVDCDDIQHKANLEITDIEELSKEQAEKLAATYQPSRSVQRFVVRQMSFETVEVPACALRKFNERTE